MCSCNPVVNVITRRHTACRPNRSEIINFLLKSARSFAKMTRSAKCKTSSKNIVMRH